MSTKLVAIILFMMAQKYAPIDKARSWPSHPETPKQRLYRYADIVQDIAYTVDKHGPIWGHSRLNTGAIMLGLAIGESNLDPDADLGPCYRKGVYKHRCDAGLAVGIIQLQDKRLKERDRMFADRRLLLKRALKAIKGSFGVCKGRPYLERLSAYASGSCTNKAGQRGSRKRLGLAVRMMGGG